MKPETFDYQSFLARKAVTDPPTGLSRVPELNAALFDFQRDITAWALRRGRAAIFADCGMGKTLMQLEWAQHVPGKVLILAPLAVAAQTIREGERFGIKVGYARPQAQVSERITITNYEMLAHFDASEFAGIVLDESSILKSYDGSTRTAIIEAFRQTPFRLAMIPSDPEVKRQNALVRRLLPDITHICVCGAPLFYADEPHDCPLKRG